MLLAPRLAPSPRSLALLLALAAGASPALGQSWLNPVNGNWNDGTKWSGGVFPNSLATTATLDLAAPYTVSFTATASAGNLVISNAGASLNILNATTFNLGGGAGFTSSTNNGTILLNSTGIQNGTNLALNANHAFTGSGRLTLNANQNDLNTAVVSRAVASVTLSNGAGHTINGTGRFIDIGLANAGTIDANIAGATLDFAGNTHTNTGLMTASAGLLALNSMSITQSGAGQITAGGTGLVRLANTTVTGGTLSTTGTAFIEVPVSTSCTFNDITNAGTLNLLNATNTFLGGSGFTNNSTVTVNSTGVQNGTQFEIGAVGYLLGGNGTIVLNANPNDLNTATIVRSTSDASFVLGANQLIRGTGRINDIVFTNNSIIRADINSRMIDIVGRSSTNNNLLTAINGATLQINAHPIVQSPTARIVADGAGSLINLVNGSLTGGALTATSGGALQIPVSTSYTLDNVTVNGPLPVSNASNLYIGAASSTDTFNGPLTINSTGIQNGTQLIMAGAADNTPLGPGPIILNANPNDLNTAVIVRGAANSTFTIPASMTIRGTGRINDIVFTNNGVISCDVPGRAFDIFARSSTNNNLITATGGSTLSFTAHVLTQAGAGRVVADGAGTTLTLINTTVHGGLITATNGALITLPVSTSLTLEGVTVNGPLNVPNASNLYIGAPANTLTLNGPLTINSTGVQNGTQLIVVGDGPATLLGTGPVILNANPNDLNTAAIVRGAANSSLVIPAAMTIRGSGRFNDIVVNNDGVISADMPGRTIDFFARSLANTNLISATGGANLSFTGHTLTQTGNGRVTIDGAGATLTLTNGLIRGGTVTASGGAVINLPVSTGFTLDGVTVNGPINVPNASNFYIGAVNSSVTLNGIFTLNSTGVQNGTQLVAVANGESSLLGSGSLVLNANPNDINTSVLVRGAANSTIRIGPGLTVSGHGRFNDIASTIAGTISPGNASTITNIDFFNRPMTFTPTTHYTARLGRSGATLVNDQLSGTAPCTLDGTLTVTLTAGYTPTRGDRFDVILMGARTGHFATVQLPSSPNGVWKYAYLPNGVRVGFACNPADPAGLGGTLGPDGGFTPDDLIVFLNAFFTNDLAIADVAGLGGSIGPDGALTVDDIIVFLNAFFAGCQQ